MEEITVRSYTSDFDNGKLLRSVNNGMVYHEGNSNV